MREVKLLKVLVLVSIIVCFVGVMGCETKTKTAADAPLPKAGFRANISFENPPTTVKAGSDLFVTVHLKNISSELWPSAGGKAPIFLAYHWLDRAGHNIIWDGIRTGPPYDLKPNKEAAIKVRVKAPGQPGDFVLVFDVVQEGITWFEKQGSKSGTLNMKVE